MRRGLSITLILLFWLGPLAATLEAGSESRLPACCRRHGAHHCAMSEAMMAAASGPAFTAPMHCPLFPENKAATVASVHALAAAAASQSALPVRRCPAALKSATPRLSPVRTHAGRGPPASLFA